MQHKIRTYAELRDQMHDALREQHPDWIEPNGDCPTCHIYEGRFAELLALFAKGAVNRSANARHPKGTKSYFAVDFCPSMRPSIVISERAQADEEDSTRTESLFFDRQR